MGPQMLTPIDYPKPTNALLYLASYAHIKRISTSKLSLSLQT